MESFKQHGYAERSINVKKMILFKIVERHEKHGENFYNADLVADFIKEAERRYSNGEIGRTYYRGLIKTATYLAELHSTGEINYARRFVPRLPDYYENLLDRVITNEIWGAKCRESVWSYAKAYFGWLCSERHCDLSTVSEPVIRQYLIDCSSRMAGSSLDATKRALKKLYIFLYETGIATERHERLLSFPVPVEKKIKRPVPHSEIAAVLNIIDRNAAKGKRDYAIVLLAAITGLRKIDIAELGLGDIDWRNGEIRITQSKTNEPLALPLTTDVGVAIRDYILNGRPESNLPNVFLRSTAPIKKVSGYTLYNLFNKYRAMAGLPKGHFHGLRRALGSNMAISGVPVTTVAQVLGHTTINSTKPYISLDSNHLKECALDFAGIEPGQGVFSAKTWDGDIQ